MERSEELKSLKRDLPCTVTNIQRCPGCIEGNFQLKHLSCDRVYEGKCRKDNARNWQTKTSCSCLPNFMPHDKLAHHEKL